MRDRPFHFAQASASMAGVIVSAPEADMSRSRLHVPRLAQLHLRGRNGTLPATVSWPAPSDRAPALLIFFPDPARESAPLVRALSRLAGVVVLTADVRSTPLDVASSAFEDASAVLGWAADHAEELDADPGRLVVAGDGAGAALAAAVALHARDEWWPAISRQVLIHPDLDAWRASVPYASSLREAALDGSAPATIVTGGDDHGACLAARLRDAGVAVDELHDVDPAVPELARTLRDLA
jgi:acetyl esterase/lipase